MKARDYDRVRRNGIDLIDVLDRGTKHGVGLQEGFLVILDIYREKQRYI